MKVFKAMQFNGQWKIIEATLIEVNGVKLVMWKAKVHHLGSENWQVDSFVSDWHENRESVKDVLVKQAQQKFDAEMRMIDAL